MSKIIRTFVAVDLPANAKKETLSWVSLLKSAGIPGFQAVTCDSSHLTIKFLGNTPSSSIGDIVKVLDLTAINSDPFQLRVQGLGIFPNFDRSGVIWVGLGGEIQRLRALRNKIDVALSRIGFSEEVRAFSPHITLGRVRSGHRELAGHRLRSILDAPRFCQIPSFSATKITLLRSVLGAQGVRYELLHTCILGDQVP